MSFKVNAIVEPHYPIKKTLLTSVADKTLEKIKVKGKVEVTISVIGDRKMRNLNRDFRGMDKTTDVLAFPQLETSKNPIQNSFKTPPSKYLVLGDVVISYPQLREKAARENILIDDMASLLVVHGILHLLGYDHEKSDEAKIMEDLEDQILSK